MTEQSTAAWSIWSDGSSLGNPGPSGWAILVRRPDGTSYTVLGNSGSETRTNSRAEMFGLLKAIKEIPEGDEPGTVYSDNQYVIGAATTWRAKWEKNGMKTSKREPVANDDLVKELWAALDVRPGVRLEWVRGHSGVQENETVDQLCRWASGQAQAGNSIKRLKKPA